MIKDSLKNLLVLSLYQMTKTKISWIIAAGAAALFIAVVCYGERLRATRAKAAPVSAAAVAPAPPANTYVDNFAIMLAIRDNKVELRTIDALTLGFEAWPSGKCYSRDQIVAALLAARASSEALGADVGATASKHRAMRS